MVWVIVGNSSWGDSSMQSELQALLEAQAAWQRSRARLSWPEKIRMAEAMRESAAQLRLIPSNERRSLAPTSTTPSTFSEKARLKE
jgi:hypothetical protein